MSRLPGFDYSRPFFYMVTLKRLKGVADFSAIGPKGLVENAVTRAMKAAIATFYGRWRCVDGNQPFIVMPDHLHLLIKIRDVEDRVHLGVVVQQLKKALREAYWRATNGGQAPAGQDTGLAGQDALPRDRRGRVVYPEIFEDAWHDWIVKKRGQLKAFARYIRENPERAWLRKMNAQYFGKVREVEFLGRKWFAYGNLALLGLPVLAAVKGHRATKPESVEWNAMVVGSSRVGPGGAGVGTFMSPLEKACGNAIVKAGGSCVVLSPEGFAARWHPPREKERFCANGRMLFLSLYPAETRQPTRAELYARCHEMGDIVAAGLESVAGLGGQAPAWQDTGVFGQVPAGQDTGVFGQAPAGQDTGAKQDTGAASGVLPPPATAGKGGSR